MSLKDLKKEVIKGKLKSEKSNCITDERVNIYALSTGRLIILCKTPHSTGYNPGTYLLIPKKEYAAEKPEEIKGKTTFLLSEKGIELQQYLKNNLNELKINYIADPICRFEFENRREIWSELKEKNLFSLWNIEFGPEKFFKGENKAYLIAFRVYKLEREVSYYKPNEKIHNVKCHNLTKEQIENARKNPVLNNREFEQLTNQIEEITGATITLLI